jgi:hypothetical protein
VGLPLTARLVTLRLNKLRRLEGVTLRRQALSTRLACSAERSAGTTGTLGRSVGAFCAFGERSSSQGCCPRGGWPLLLNDVSAIADRIVKPRDANASTCLLLTRLPSWRTMPGVQRSVSAILRSGALLWIGQDSTLIDVFSGMPRHRGRIGQRTGSACPRVALQDNPILTRVRRLSFCRHDDCS